MENLRIDEKSGNLIVRFRGELTKEVSADLKKAVEAAMVKFGPDLVAMDMTEVSLMDSSGIGLLVSLNAAVMGMGKRMVIFGMAARVRKTLELVQLNDFFTIVADENDLSQP